MAPTPDRQPNDVDLPDPDEPGISEDERQRRQAAVDERNQGQRKS